MPRSRSTFIQSERARRCSPRALTAPAIWIAPPNSSSFSGKGVLPASGCAMIAKVRRRATSFSRFVGMCLDVPKSRRECRDFSADFQGIQRRRLVLPLHFPNIGARVWSGPDLSKLAANLPGLGRMRLLAIPYGLTKEAVAVSVLGQSRMRLQRRLPLIESDAPANEDRPGFHKQRIELLVDRHHAIAVDV